MKIPCIKCGLCCRAKDVVCKQLKGNMCSIYDNRPNMCNAEKVYQMYFKNKMTEAEYIKFNLNCCIELAKKAGKAKIIKKLMRIQRRLKWQS